MQRRSFLKASAQAGLGALLSPALRAVTPDTASAADSHIEILLEEPVATISPNVYGHFIEHLGTVIYGGVWVGKESKIANRGGVRQALIDKLIAIHAPMIRWPGGCFADSYDWRDGVGADRPRRTNFWASEFETSRLKDESKSIYDTNAFGTDEFLSMCRGAHLEPYLAANVRSLTPLDFDRWVEYCNSPAGTTTMAEMRARGGSTEPYNVKLWGIGNESWGCGGNFTPQDYATEFRRFTAWVPEYGLPVKYIASGPSDNDLAWTRGFFEKAFSMGDHAISGWSVHHYAWNTSRGRTSDWVEGKGDALKFDEVGWYEIFREGNRMEKIITDQWAAIGEYDGEHNIKLVIDEYGPWYRKGTEVSADAILSQQVTIRDALFTAFTLDIFNRHADKVSMAACAQLINCINSLFLAHEDKFVVTPNYYVFDMYKAHQGGLSLRTEISSPAAKYMRDGKAATFWGLNGSASVKDKTLTLTVVNADLSTPRETEIRLRGASITSASVKTLTSDDMHAHNAFDLSQVAEPVAKDAQFSAGTLRVAFPPRSVNAMTVQLA